MSEQEKEAIKNLKFCLTTNNDISIYDGTTIPVKITDIQILLNLLSKKDKVIDLMAEVIEECRQNDVIEFNENIDLSEIAGENRIKEYFYKKVEEENE